MPTWLTLILVAAIGGAIISFFASDSKDKKEDAAAGAAAGAMGCISILFQIFMAGLSLYFIIWLFRTIF